MCSFRGHTHSFHNSGWGWHLIPPNDPAVRESPMESLLGGRPGPQTMDGLASTGLLLVVTPCPGELSPELLGAERSGGRRTDEASATSAPWHPAPVVLDESERTRGDIVRSLETQTSLPGLSQISPKSVSLKSIPRASAPVSTGCLLPDWSTQGWKLPSRRAVSLGSTRGSERRPTWWLM